MSSFQSFNSLGVIKSQMKPSSNQNPHQNQSYQISPLNPTDNLAQNQNSSLNDSNPIKLTKRTKKVGSICNFIAKVYSMLQQKQIRHIVSWSQKEISLSAKNLETQENNQLRPQLNPNSFQILDLQSFEQIVLPKYFKHSNMSSFVRQLNMYGFHKLKGDKNNFEFGHEKFVKNNKELLCQIQRKGPQFGIASNCNLEDKKQFIVNNQSNIFPTQSFLTEKRFSEQFEDQNGVERFEQIKKARKLEFIKEEIGRLKRIKLAKSERIKQLMAENKSQIEVKFTKTVISVIALKLRQEIGKKRPQFKKIQKPIIPNESLNMLTNHILSLQGSQSINVYTQLCKDLGFQK